MTSQRTVEFDNRDALTDALRQIKDSGGDLSQVLIFTATSPPRLVMASDIYDTWARSRDARDPSTAPRSPSSPDGDNPAADGPSEEPASAPASPHTRKTAPTKRRKSAKKETTDG